MPENSGENLTPPEDSKIPETVPDETKPRKKRTTDLAPEGVLESEQKPEENETIELPENKELLSIEEGVKYLSQKMEEMLKEKSHRPIGIAVYGANHAGKTYFMNRFCTENKSRFKIVSNNMGGPLDDEIPYEPLTKIEKDILKEENSPEAIKIKAELRRKWAERKASADCFIFHDDGVAMAEWMKSYQHQYPGDSYSEAKIAEEEGELKIDFSVYIYNPNLRHRVDEKMRSLVDLVICNKESENRHEKYKRTGHE